MAAVAAIRHVSFEDLGSLEPALRAANYDIAYHDAGSAAFDATACAEADLLIILGGPIGAYQDDLYPFLKDELKVLEARLAANRPTLGICLGAQLLARALGSRVYPSGIAEIGWAEVDLTDAGRSSPIRHFDGLPVLHWHGDTFDLPDGCVHLASTPLIRNQGFARGPNILGLQFHCETEAARIESWLIGHACELDQKGIDPVKLRQRTAEAAPALALQARLFLAEWLESLIADHMPATFPSV